MMNRNKTMLVLALVLVASGLLGGLSVYAQSTQTLLEVQVDHIVVNKGQAQIVSPAVGSMIELYDNLGKELIDTGTAGPDGKLTFPLDSRFPRSEKGLFHTVIFVDGVRNGEFTCQEGTTCKETVFTFEGLDASKNDGILVIRAVHSSDGSPVQKVYLDAWPADENGTPFTESMVPGRENGVRCGTNEEGLCVAYLDEYFHWGPGPDGVISAIATVKYNGFVVADGTLNRVLESGIAQDTIAFTDEGKLDDCTFTFPPLDGRSNQSCKDKATQTATAQALVTVDPLKRALMNAAIIQANDQDRNSNGPASKDFPSSGKIGQLIDDQLKRTFDSDKQFKLILDVHEINNDGFNASIGGHAIGKYSIAVSPEEPGNLLGACQVNTLGECVIIIDRQSVLDSDGLLKTRVIVDGYDNGILVCENGMACEQQAYAVTGLQDFNDAVVLVKLVHEDDLWLPYPDRPIYTGSDLNKKSTYFWRCNWADGCSLLSTDQDYRKQCTSDQNGACPLYIDDKEFAWREIGDVLQGVVDIEVTGAIGNDSKNIYTRDGQLRIVYLAITSKGNLDDCTFTSPLDPTEINSTCTQKKIALQTEMASYTATPTVTNTPLATRTPTATEIPPTPTVTLTPTPQPGLFPEGSLSWGIPVGAAAIVLLVGGVIFLTLRRKRK